MTERDGETERPRGLIDALMRTPPLSGVCPVSPKAANVRLRLRLILRRSELPCESLPRSGAGMHTRSEPTPALVDRQRERQALDSLMGDLRSGRGRALVVRGEAGVGKSALLEYAAGAAADIRVIRAAGVESEMELAFAGLHQLCAPLLDHLERLPAPQRDALGVVFGLRGGGAPDRFLVGLAVLTL